jgi:hypothetical protein
VRFDWTAFCKDHGVEFAEKGPSVSRGNVNIRCPYCDDKGTHLGLSLDVLKPYWACWRCKAGGRDPTRLVGTLLNVPAYRAKNVVAEYGAPPVDEFEALFLFEQEGGPGKAPDRPKEGLSLPKECRPILSERPAARRFLNYMADDRGFGEDAEQLCQDYRLHYAISGEQAWRVVLPVYGPGDKLLAWTGRSIHRDASLRYLADPHKGTREVVANLRDLSLSRAPLLGIAEGPIDFLKLDFYGRSEGLRATCTFGVSYSDRQVGYLASIVPNFERVFVLYDASAYMDGARLAEHLGTVSRRQVLPVALSGSKDYGEFTPEQVRALAGRLLRHSL